MQDYDVLIRPITKREVYKTLTSMPRGKSPGPDGLNVDFYVFYWNILGDPLFKAISFFFETANLPHSSGKTFIALIAKKDNLVLVSDFRPISLCNVFYKIIAKFFASHLHYVIHKLVGAEQNGFIPGCGTSDNVITALEIAHSLEFDNTTLPKMVIKVDIEKAFDTIE